MRKTQRQMRWNKPSRTDHYIMQATLFGAQNPDMSISDLTIPFEFSKPETPLQKKKRLHDRSIADKKKMRQRFG